jgi:hypothetical protein
MAVSAKLIVREFGLGIVADGGIFPKDSLIFLKAKINLSLLKFGFDNRGLKTNHRTAKAGKRFTIHLIF